MSQWLFSSLLRWFCVISCWFLGENSQLEAEHAEFFDPRDVARRRVTWSGLNVEWQIYDFNDGCLPCH